jgi:membrane protein
MQRIKRVFNREMAEAKKAATPYEGHWTVTLVRNYLDDDADGLASIIAFAGMFSMMPILIVTFALITVLLRLNVVHDALTGALADEIPSYITERIETLLDKGNDNLAGLGLMTFITFLLGGSKLYSAMDRACARIFRVERQAYARRKLFSIVMMPLIPLLILATTILSAIATALLALPIDQLIDIKPNVEETVIGYFFSFMSGFVLLLLAYYRIPEKRPPMRAAAVGAAVGGGLIVLLAQFFPIYVAITGGYSLYGAIFAFVLLVLLWLYLMGQIFVIGAEVVAYRAGRRARPRPGARRPAPNGAQPPTNEEGS